MKYNYYEAVKEDVRNYCNEEVDLCSLSISDRDELETYLYDTLWIEDSVTGNGSGSYTFNRYEAEENLAHNLDLYVEACEYFGDDPARLLDDPEAMDVTIRCYLLDEAISDVLDEMSDDLEKYFDELQEEEAC